MEKEEVEDVGETLLSLKPSVGALVLASSSRLWRSRNLVEPLLIHSLQNRCGNPGLENKPK